MLVYFVGLSLHHFYPWKLVMIVVVAIEQLVMGILTDRYHLLICRLLPQPSGLVVQL